MIRPERVEFKMPPELPGVVAARIENSPQHWRWFHETYSIATMIDGGGTWSVDRRTHETTPGTLSFWQPGDLHAVRKLYPDRAGNPVTTQRCLMIAPEYVEEAARRLGVVRTRVRRRIDDAAPLYRAFRRLHAATEDPSTPRLELESRLARCVDLMVRRIFEDSGRSAEVGAETEGVRRAKALMRERLPENLGLDQLEAVSGLDRFRLLRAFVREHGIPPHQFHLAMRVSRARELLVRRRPAAQIAAELGFADQSHFIRVFRRQMAITPGTYGR